MATRRISDDVRMAMLAVQDPTPVSKYYDQALMTVRDFGSLVLAKFTDVLEDAQTPFFLATDEDAVDELEELYYGNQFTELFDDDVLDRIGESLAGISTSFALGYIHPSDPFHGMFAAPGDDTMSAIGIGYTDPMTTFIVGGSAEAKWNWGYRVAAEAYRTNGKNSSFRAWMTSDSAHIDVEPDQKRLSQESRAFVSDVHRYLRQLNGPIAEHEGILQVMYEARGHTGGGQSSLFHVTWVGTDEEKSLAVPMHVVREKTQEVARYIEERFDHYFPPNLMLG